MKGFLLFIGGAAAGAAAGAAITYMVVSQRYEKEINTEVREIRERFYNKASKEEPSKAEETKTEETPVEIEETQEQEQEPDYTEALAYNEKLKNLTPKESEDLAKTKDGYGEIYETIYQISERFFNEASIDDYKKSVIHIYDDDICIDQDGLTFTTEELKLKITKDLFDESLIDHDEFFVENENNNTLYKLIYENVYYDK